MTGGQTSYADLAALVWLVLIVLGTLTVLCRLGRRGPCVAYAASVVVVASALTGGAP